MDDNSARTLQLFIMCFTAIIVLTVGSCSWMGIECTKAGKFWYGGSGICSDKARD